MSKISRNNNNQDLPWQFSVLSYIIYGILFLIPLYFNQSTVFFFLYICTLFAFILGELISLKKSILPSFLLASFVSAVLVALISYFGPEGFGRSTQFFDN